MAEISFFFFGGDRLCVLLLKNSTPYSPTVLVWYLGVFTFPRHFLRMCSIGGGVFPEELNSGFVDSSRAELGIFRLCSFRNNLYVNRLVSPCDVMVLSFHLTVLRTPSCGFRASVSVSRYCEPWVGFCQFRELSETSELARDIDVSNYVHPIPFL